MSGKPIIGGGLFLGVIAALSVYLLFFRKKKTIARKQHGKPNVSRLDSYKGRTKFYGKDGDKDNYVQGFRLPDDINDIKLQNNNKVAVISKPDAPVLFGNIQPRTIFKVFKVGNKCLGYKDINGVLYHHKYEDIKNDIVVLKNTSLT